MGRTLRAAILAATAAAALVACGSGDPYLDGTAAPGTESADMKVESMASDGTSAPAVDQQVIQTANVSLEVDDVDQAVNGVEAQVEQLGGVVQSRSINNYDDDASAYMTIRIPAQDLNGFLDGLPALGRVINSTVDAQDVTLEVIDLEARISTLEASIDRLRDLQRQATSVADLVAVESELATRQSELESLTARRDYLANQVDLSTVYVSMDQVDTGAALRPDFLGGLQRGWDALLTLGAGLVTGVGFLLPLAIVGAAIAAVIIVIVRAIRRRTKQEEKS